MAFVLMAASCGDAESADGENAGPASFDELDYRSPIQEALGVESWWDEFFAQADREAAVARAREVEEEVVRCMTAQGFEYTPVDPATYLTAAYLDEFPRYSPEWIDRYGFGLSTQLFPQSALFSPDLVGRNDQGQEQVVPQTPDPNMAYQASLSKGDLSAYFQALYGETGDTHEELPETDHDHSNDQSSVGCFAEADAAIEAPGRFFDTFADEMADLRARFSADPRVMEYRSEVRRCVAENGFDFVSVDDEIDTWLNEVEPVLYSIPPDGRSFPASGDGPGPTLSPAQEDELLRIQEEERELANVVVDCGGGELNELAALGEVQAALETEFVEEHGQRLALWLRGPAKDD